MTAKINKDFLKATTQDAQERLKEKRERENEKENEKVEKIAQERADEIIKNLASNLQKAAESGKDNLCVVNMIMSDVQMRTAQIVAAYCEEQGLSISFHESKPIGSDCYPAHHFLVISWAD